MSAVSRGAFRKGGAERVIRAHVESSHEDAVFLFQMPNDGGRGISLLAGGQTHMNDPNIQKDPYVYFDFQQTAGLIMVSPFLGLRVRRQKGFRGKNEWKSGRFLRQWPWQNRNRDSPAFRPKSLPGRIFGVGPPARISLSPMISAPAFLDSLCHTVNIDLSGDVIFAMLGVKAHEGDFHGSSLFFISARE